MKKIYSLITLLMLVFQSTMATVTITAPEKPASLDAEFVIGKNYCLYNLLHGRFVGYSTYSYSILGFDSDTLKVKIEEYTDSTYAFCFNNESATYYIQSYSDMYSYCRVESLSRYESEKYEFNIVASGAGVYKIQNVYYKSWWYFNYSSYYTRLTGHNLGDEWAFIPETVYTDEEKLAEIRRYGAKVSLYNAIVEADANGKDVAYYESIYNNDAISLEYLQMATMSLKCDWTKATSIDVQSWNEADISMTDSVNSEHYYFTEVKTIETSKCFIVPVFTSSSSNSNFNVYVDGIIWNGSNFPQGTEITLPEGEHHIDMICNACYISSIGVIHTPTISVTLDAPGQLESKVKEELTKLGLDETDFSKVHKLKISGPMNIVDENNIRKMTMLCSLDLSETNITRIRNEFFSRTHNSEYTGFLTEIVLPNGLKTIGDNAFNASLIENINFPDGLESIGSYAFASSYIKEVKTKNLSSLGDNAFYRCYFLERVQLEGALDTIPNGAFEDCYNLNEVSVPDEVRVIGWYAFSDCRNLTLFNLPAGLKTVQYYAFDMSSHHNELLTLHLPEGLENIGTYALRGIKSIDGIPSSVKYIGSYAFDYSLDIDTLVIPKGCSCSYAFQKSLIKNVVLQDNSLKYYSQTFSNCNSLRSITLLSPTMVPSGDRSLVGDLTKANIKLYVPDYLINAYLEDDYWNAFDVQTFQSKEMDSILIAQDLTLGEEFRFMGKPTIEVAEGKVFIVEGTDGMELNDMILSNDICLSYNTDKAYSQLWTSTDKITIGGTMSERFRTKGNNWYYLSLPFDCDLSLTVNEDGAYYAVRYYDGNSRATKEYGRIDRTLYPYPESEHDYPDNLTETTAGNKQRFSYPGADRLILQFGPSSVLYNSDDTIFVKGAGSSQWFTANHLGDEVTVEGDYFDIWIKSNSSGTGYGYDFTAIYVNSKEPAGNWCDYDRDNDIIKAGTGFVFMTSKDSWTRFYSVDNATKQSVYFSADNEANAVTLPLQKNYSANASDCGWNLVGNPFPNYYSNHSISFSAPITIWTGSTYQAISLQDDDVAIEPCQAFFVQCPAEGNAEIGFPVSGRQLSNVVTSSYAGARALPGVINITPSSERKLFDLSLSGNDGEDKTRVVLNDNAALEYELSCDAAKFMSMDATVPQIYSVGADDTRYSINERPVANGAVQLGTRFPQTGEYTIALARSAAAKVLLTDNETGETINITNNEYTFSAKAGMSDSRFTVSFENIATDIDAVATDNEAVAGEAVERIYTIDGRLVNAITIPGTYIVRGKKGVRKVYGK